MPRDKFTRSWIIEKAVPIARTYGGNLTIRQLYYRLVADHHLTNSQNHYKRVVNAMIQARWEGDLHFTSFKDHDREMIGQTDWTETSVKRAVESAKGSIKFWMNYYSKNRWENQPYYLEVFIEKKALQGVFEQPCRQLNVGLCPCKGYPSLTYVYDAMQRMKEAAQAGKHVVILYFGDHDPSGDDIPRSIEDNLYDMGFSDFDLDRIALTKEQVIAWDLPPAPTKSTDSRSAKWDGLGQVELDAVEPSKLQSICTDAIHKYFDEDLYDFLLDQEWEEKKKYKKKLKKFVKTL